MYFCNFLLTLCLLASNVISNQIPEKTRRLIGSSFGIPGTNATYDYVIVGGGTAGLTVAKRLSEDPSISIAVIEAGSFYEIGNGNLSQVPFFYSRYTQNDPAGIQPLVDWGIMTKNQPQLNGRSLHIAQGKCLGGSSARNQMIYHRGTIGAYQALADKVGDQSYTFSNMLPFFKKSIAFTPPNTLKRPSNASASFLPSAYSPTGGPVHVSFPNYAYPFSSWGAIALKAIGIKETSDFSSGILNGSQYVPYTIDPEDETRSSSETSFLRAALGDTESGLTVYQSAMATKIMFDENKTAFAVNISTNGMPYVISARKEVIISAGVFHSPQLLMVSGIGPAETLEKFNIPVISNLPGVGQNMKDSCRVGAVTHPIDIETFSIASLATSPVLRASITSEFLTNQTGVFTNPNSEYIGWEKIPFPLRHSLSTNALSELAQFPDDWPEVEYLVSSAPVASITANSTSVFINAGSIGFSLVATISKGNVTIGSASIFDAPIVSPNWMLESTDLEVAVAAFKRAREAWKVIEGNVSVGPEIVPGANVTTDTELMTYIRQNVAAVHHSTATCSMGQSTSLFTVVDSHARVLGVNNLRVIDASSLPFTPPGHSQGAVYAHAEKLVDDIKNGL